MHLPRPSSSQHVGWWLFAVVVIALLVWITFFDSHSLLQRYRWHQELEVLTQENKQLRHQIEQLQHRIDRPLPDSTVKRIAREEYGMKRPGETVYRVE